MKLPATAVIFCGGRSTRMGQDKALLEWKGRPLAAVVASRVAPVFERVVVSGDPRIYRQLGLPCIPDLAGSGPLAGLYATLLESKSPAIFAVACDMPLVEPAAVLALWRRLQGFDAAVPLTRRGPEPLHAWYTRRILPAAGRALQGKGRMTGWWGECEVARVDAASLPGGERGLWDCDTPADWESLRSR
ncbi:MAG: molybdenum cofactor guanylyltransferase [Planctomycetota bacterium]